jgi:hypothetical protein
MSQVPRVPDITGKKTAEQVRDEREWQRARRPFNDIKAKFGYGTPEAKAEWLRRIRQTRSF